MKSRRPFNSDVVRLALSMKTILTLTFVAFLASCSYSDKSLPPVATNSPAQTLTDDGLPSPSYEQMLPELARISKQAGLPNLRNMNLSDTQTELRLWKAFGLAYPVCFVLSIDNGNPAASFVSPKVVGNKAVFHKGNPIYVNARLNAPHSGWYNLLGYLKQNGIDSSIKLVVDKRFMPYPDADELVLEMKTGSNHTLTQYIDSTVTVDGKKAFAICEKIQNEFDIQLACKM